MPESQSVLYVRFYRMNSTGRSWTACWTSPGSVLLLVNTATGPPRWGPVRFPQRLWFWVRWQTDLLSSHVMVYDTFGIWGNLETWSILLTLPSSGVNVPDHDMTFQSLSELLQQSVSPFVASVQAKECGGERLFAFSVTTLFCVTNIPTYM